MTYSCPGKSLVPGAGMEVAGHGGQVEEDDEVSGWWSASAQLKLDGSGKTEVMLTARIPHYEEPDIRAK